MDFSGNLLIGGTIYKEIEANETISALLTPGVHTIRFEHDNARYEDYEIRVSVDWDRTVTIEDLVEEIYSVQITTEPVGAEVFLDDEKIGITPLHKDLKYGRYDIRLEKEKYRPISSILIVGGNSSYARTLYEIGATVTLVDDEEYMPYDKITIGYSTFSDKKTGIRTGEQKVTIGNTIFNYTFENGHEYEILPVFPYPKKSFYSYSSAFPGKNQLPEYPELLDEEKPIVRTGFAYLPLMMAFPIGLYALIGYAVEDKEEDKVFSALRGAGLGLAAGLLFSLVNSEELSKEKIVRYDLIEDAIASNQVTLEEWEAAKAAVEAENQRKIYALNDAIREENRKIDEKNADRGYVLVNDLTTRISKRHNL
jgi:hypothetical protein